MPFRDEKWEELQRDCDIFPAYSDYLYGPDRRLVVTQEPGLHPLLYPTPTPQPSQNTTIVPIDRSQPRRQPRTATESKNSRQQAMSQQHGHVHVPSTSRMNTYSTPIGVNQYQYPTNSYTSPTRQAPHRPLPPSKPSSSTQIPLSTFRPTQNAQTSRSVYPITQPSPISPEITERASQQDPAQLRAYLNPRIPQVWNCLQLVLQAPEGMSVQALKQRHLAQQWLRSFKYSIPPEGRDYVAQVIGQMNAEKAAGRDPLLSLGFQV